MLQRVYGADHDDPDPGPRPGRARAAPDQPPRQRLLLDVTGWRGQDLQAGAALVTEVGRYGPGGRVVYVPREGDPQRWDWLADIPG